MNLTKVFKALTGSTCGILAETHTLAQCLALYLGYPGKFSVDFQASTGKELRENNHGNNYGTREIDVKHSAND